jgi:hypothetical protein
VERSTSGGGTVDEGRLVAIARTQHGLVTRAQALDHGASDATIHRRVASGRWDRVRPGVYALGAAPSTWTQRVLAAVLAVGIGTLASHRTAARLWELVDRSGRIELLIGDDRHLSPPGVEVHRTRHLGPPDRADRDGVPCTSLARTIVDVAASADAVVVGRWVDLAMRDHGLAVDELATRASQLAVRGRPLPRSLVEALALRSDGHDPGRSALESRAIEAIVRAGLPAPERQWRFDRAGGGSGFIDLAYPGLRLAIELDGWAEHGLRAAFDADRMRGNELVLAGWRLLRFTWSMTDEEIVAAIASAIAIA